MEKIFQHVGYVRLSHMSAIDCIIWISPEIVMLFISIACLVVIKKLTTPIEEDEAAETGAVRHTSKKKKNVGRLVTFGKKFS